MSSPDLPATLASFARAIGSQDDTGATIEEVTNAVVKQLPNVDGAGITLVSSTDVTCKAPTHDFVAQADALQHELRDGPCIQALRSDRRVQVRDLREETRWPAWTEPVASRLEVRSVLALQLYVTGESLGALNLYSRTVDAFDSECVDEAEYFAAHAAVVLAKTLQVDQFREAATTRTVIGQAQGLLMQRFDLDADQAFATLRRYSQSQNVKLNEIARRLVETRSFDV